MIKFGPSGNSDLFYKQGHKSSLEMPQWLKEMGLDAYEYSFGRGIRIKESTARELGLKARDAGIIMSVHAPYYINLATPEEEKKQNSIRYIIQSMTAASWLGAKRVVVHPGTPGKLHRKDALDMAKTLIDEVLEEVNKHELSDITICLETMGKKNQLGTLNEVMELCKLDKSLYPTIDFGHLYARDCGGIKGKDDYARIIDTIESSLKDERARRFHVHFSRIEYTDSGEKRHWTLKDKEYGPEFEPLAELLVERQLEPTIICESRGTMAEDALKLKQIYLNELKQRE